MKFLVDTNILIAVEPTSTVLEPTAAIAAEFIGLATSTGHQVVRHSAQGADQSRDRNDSRRSARAVLLAKYSVLPRIRPMPADLVATLGAPETGSNDWVDNELIGAVEAGAVDFLVTEDARLHRKARRLSLEDRVLYVGGARDLLLTLLDRPPAAPPSVRWIVATELAETDPIFASLRIDYPDFDTWLQRCRLEERDVALITTEDGGYAALCIVARKADKFGTAGSWLKIGTFKVADEYRGRRYGELLLKAIFLYREVNGFDFAYVTAFERQEALIRMFEDFGFARYIDRTQRDEAILLKPFRPTGADRDAMTPLEYHTTFGPPALSVVADQTFMVPILPRYHRLLFPDAERQLDLPGLETDRPFGNALRKAYLCHATTGAIGPGATLLFYRSHDLKAVTCLGVVEEASREVSAEAVTRLVSTRTVYSSDEIERMATKPVLVIRFRQDRVLDRPLGLADMRARGLISSHPQTVIRVRKEGVSWLREQISS